MCHGLVLDVSAGSVPDLTRINAATYALFSQIVRGGLYKDAGMRCSPTPFARTICLHSRPTLSMKRGRAIGRSRSPARQNDLGLAGDC
jgi:hypothetical protein